MTTQPEQAVGGEAVTPSDDPMDAFEAIAGEMLNEEQEEAPQDDEPQTDEAPEADDELDDVEIEDEADDLPPIDPPVSLTAEEKEAFAKLPREAQEFTARRIGELEKGFQTKAQEAAQKERSAMKQAAEYLQQANGESAEILAYYSNLLVVPRPPARLSVENPALYAQQLEAHEQSIAQRDEAQQRVEDFKAQQRQYQDLLQKHEAEQFHQRLTQDLPELLDPTTGPALKAQLEATGRELGFSEDELFNANATQIIALKRISDLKAKADKYDALQRKKMERVRAGKTPPPVTKPGAPRAASLVRHQKAEQAFQRAKELRGGARDDAFAEYLVNSGQL